MRSPRRKRGIRVDQLLKHLFVCGMTGGGKSTLLFHLLLQLCRRNIPFLIIEPGKSEYRLIKCLKNHPHSEARRLARKLQVYTPGKDDISPFRMNPLRIPQGISVDEHIENLLTCFKAAMPISGPLLPLLREALERVYDDRPDPGNPPRMRDLYAAAEAVLDDAGYAGEVDSNLRGAIRLRLGLMVKGLVGRIFQCLRDVPSIGQLVGGRVLIEMAGLAEDPLCFTVLVILMAVCVHVKTTPYSGRGIRLAIVLEEAHNIIGRSRDASASEENADPKSFASEFICLMLAELRALGVAIIIADQYPSALAPEVIKGTGTKVTFHELDTADRDILAGTMLLGPIEHEEAARLRPGEAYLFTEGYFGPRRIRTPNLHADLSLPRPPLGRAILPYLQDDAWFTEAAQARIATELEQLRGEMDRFDSVRLAIIKQAAVLRAKGVRILAGHVPGQRSRRLAQQARRVRALRDRLDRAFRIFRRDAYRPLRGPESHLQVCDEALQSYREHLVRRFERVVEPDTRSCLDLLNRLIRDRDGHYPNKKGA